MANFALCTHKFESGYGSKNKKIDWCDFKTRNTTFLVVNHIVQEQDIIWFSKIEFVPCTKNLNQGQIRDGLMREVYNSSKDEMLSVEDFSYLSLSVTAYSTVNFTGKFEQVCDQIKYFMFNR